MDIFALVFFLQYNWLQLDKIKNERKIFYKEITKKETRKCSTSKYVTALSNRTVKKESGLGGRRRKKWICIFKAKEIKQCYWKLVIMYLIEAFKMRLLSIAENFESPKRSNSTFKW